jgi:nucleoside-triphosphatase THEP1
MHLSDIDQNELNYDKSELTCQEVNEMNKGLFENGISHYELMIIDEIANNARFEFSKAVEIIEKSTRKAIKNYHDHLIKEQQLGTKFERPIIVHLDKLQAQLKRAIQVSKEF